MGSDSDWPVMEAAVTALQEFGVAWEADVVSAHRMPREMLSYGSEAAGRGLRVIIAGAGGAAHLPGMSSVSPGRPTWCRRTGCPGRCSATAPRLRAAGSV